MKLLILVLILFFSGCDAMSESFKAGKPPPDCTKLLKQEDDDDFFFASPPKYWMKNSPYSLKWTPAMSGGSRKKHPPECVNPETSKPK